MTDRERNGGNDMEITLDFLEKEEACCDGVAWFKAQKKTSLDDVVSELAEEGKLDWANWLLCHVFSHEQKIQYAVFSAEQVLHLFEQQNPGDNRPRLAIEAAKAVLKENTQATREAARAAADAADAGGLAASRAAGDARTVARDARDAWAAWSAAWAARAASRAAGAASRAAARDAWAAWSAAGDAPRDAMKLKIILYGCGLLKIDTSKWERGK